MDNIQITERVQAIRDKYLSSPMISKQLGYEYLRYNESFSVFGFCLQKQRLLYMEGWEKNSDAYTTRLRRAKATAYVLENMPVIIDENELIVGKPDLSELTPDDAEKLKNYEQIMKAVAPNYFGRVDHCALDFEKLLRVGVKGLIEEINDYKSNLTYYDPEDVRKNEFYDACLIELEGIISLQKRYACAASQAATEASGERKKELEEIAECLKQVPYLPARNFREALQSIHFYSFNLWGLYLAGRPDQYLYPFYQKDIADGILTKEKAQELIDCFCLMYSTYVITSSSIGFMVGGSDKNGNPVENELTWAFVRSAGHTRTAYPSVGLAVNEHTSDDLFKFSVEQISEGVSHPALFNDRAITNAMIKAGFKPEDARQFIHSACVEITPCNKSGIWVVSPYINVMQLLIDVLESNTEFKSLDEIIERFREYLFDFVKEGISQQNRWQLERSRNGAEPMRASCLIDDCLKRGKSRCEGGAVYNDICPSFIGISNVVETLLTIKTLVFEKNEYSIPELNEIVKNDYAGNEALRQKIINKIKHFGNNETESDAMAQRITGIVAESCVGLRTFFGGNVLPANFSYNQHEVFGKETQATPDGRHAGYPLADGSGPVQGRDTMGPTLSILSSTSWDHSPFIGGIAVNMKFTKKQFLSNGTANAIALIKTFMERDGFEIQFSIVDADTLRKAQQDPENYRDLTVRIGGYSDYFVNLPIALQDEIIDRTEHLF